jgi:carboxylesterase type B
LGAFGWLAGSSLTADGTANAALHDQRLALRWIQKNIHLFGGDPSRVTVMGESAGAGSIMHQITAYGGKNGSAPFQQAIIQSPGWNPIPSPEQQEQTLQQFLEVLNVSSVEEARRLPSAALIAGNAYQIATKAFYGSFIYGPVVDGTFAPALPGQLLLSGDFDRNLSVMVGHNTNEGLAFVNPNGTKSNFLPNILKDLFPTIKTNVTRYITDVLYPAQYDGKWGYTNPLARAALVLSDSAFECNTDYLNRAYQNQTYAYEFSIPPGLHGQDVLYTFFDNGTSTVTSNLGVSVTNVTVAHAMQDWFVSFTHGGSPRSSLTPTFPRYGARGQLMNIGNDTIAAVHDTTNNPRCRFWQTAPYYQ